MTYGNVASETSYDIWELTSKYLVAIETYLSIRSE
jgi:hypothetical protein